ncbi:hypothetical protein Tco_1569346 [Tanacetum coccineum]
MPDYRVVDRSASSRIIYVGVSSGSESFFHMERGIKLMLAPRSTKAKHSSNSRKSHRMRNLPGSLWKTRRGLNSLKFFKFKVGEGDGVSNWTSSRVIGERVRVMSIDAFSLSLVGGGRNSWRSIEDEEVSLVDGVLEGALGALEALEMEALVDAMDVDNG